MQVNYLYVGRRSHWGFYALIAILSLFSNQSAFAQAINNQIKDVVMPSPNAASLGKYGDIPVSYNTGVPSIGIPIHTVTDGPLSMPVSLSYHASGVKVGEPSSWVGLGWSLSTGGMISRTVQGKADERADGFMAIGAQLNIYGFSSGSSITPTDLASGAKDGEPDVFSFSVGGYSGKFYIDVKSDPSALTGTAVVIPKQDVIIQYFFKSASQSYDRLNKFVVTTPDGTIYEFGDNGDGSPALEYSSNNDFSLTASGWYLKKIMSQDLTSSIKFTYLPEEYRLGCD